MILYTPISESEIFSSSTSEFTKRHCISYEGRLCIAQQQENGSYELVQLLSTDPQDFLDSKFLPGEVVQ